MNTTTFSSATYFICPFNISVWRYIKPLGVILPLDGVIGDVVSSSKTTVCICKTYTQGQWDTASSSNRFVVLGHCSCVFTRQRAIHDRNEACKDDDWQNRKNKLFPAVKLRQNKKLLRRCSGRTSIIVSHVDICPNPIANTCSSF